ncbi:5'-nucleotidase-like isoform X1 [Hemitrygon akajei]|uniref:5'-nucleotidase-like isoform X1 n=1 Tax=Hemitrygon akajei TaxID=2704970 RepID=UPI003BF964B6
MEWLQPPSMGRAAALLWLPLLLCTGRTAAFQLTVLHTNDVHARVEETSEDSSKCVTKCFAGVARRWTKIKELRGKEPNVLLLDAGDQYQGTIWFNYYKGTEAAHFMKKLNYDVMALGNHEFDNGPNGLLEPFLKNVSFPVLSANLKEDKDQVPSLRGYYKPSTVMTVSGEKIGVVGYTSKYTPTLSSPGPHLIFEDEIQAVQREVDKLIKMGVNKIIALGHSGFETDKQIAQKVRGVDVVVGGHSNTFLYTGKAPSNDVPAGLYPYMVTSDSGQRIPVVQAFAYGKYLGYLKLTFSQDGAVTKAEGNPILLDSSIPEDKEILADVGSWKAALANFGKEYVGRTLVYLDGTTKSCRNQECNMGNLICDAMIRESVRKPDEKFWSHVSICITQGGGIRSPIDERTGNGRIQMDSLMAVLPFGSTVDLLEVKGSTIRAAFEHSVRRYGMNTGEFLQVSGIQVEFNLKRPPGSRVVRLNVLCADCRVPHYQPLLDTKTYKIVANSYIANGGDGFAMLKSGALRHDTGNTDISVVSSYMKQLQVVYPAVEGRILFTDNGGTRHGSNLTFALSLFSFLAWFLQF